jgi:hypothetical protein
MKKIISIVCASAYFGQLAHALNSDDHRRVTQKAAAGLFSPQAAQVLAQAATEPDVYDWDTAAAHAQTPNDSNGNPALSPSQAVEQCVSYLADKAKQFRAQLGAGNVGNAIYILGYTLHTIQDFSAHQGITNAEHSYLSFVRNLNPDEDARRVSRAEEWTRTFLAEVQHDLSHCAWERLSTFTHRSARADHWRDIPTFAYKKQTNFWSDTGPADIAKYMALAGRGSNSPRLTIWEPIDSTEVALQAAFASGLLGQDDTAWLLEGVWSGNWTGNGASKATIVREGPGYQMRLQLSRSQHSYTLDRDGSILRTEPLLTATFLQSQKMPSAVLGNVLGKVREYLTFKFSGQTCEIDARYDQDRVWWQSDSKTGKFTGRYGMERRSPKYSDTAVLKWQESAQ